MLVRYWQPLREVDTLRRQMDQVFDDLARTTFGQVPAWSPAIELSDNGNTILLRVQLPGIDVKDLDVQVNRETVSITAERRNANPSEQDEFYRSEFRYGVYKRTVTLPVEVQPDQVNADYKDGILHLTLPKVEQVKNEFVKVRLTTEETAPKEGEGTSDLVQG
jgi:HSP20 family protein